MKVKYDENYNFSIDDLPPETFEPPPSPRGQLRTDINNLTNEMNSAIRRKQYQKLPLLIKRAIELAPTEMEYVICSAQLMLQKRKEQRLLYQGDLLEEEKDEGSEPEQAKGKDGDGDVEFMDRIRPDFSTMKRTVIAEEGVQEGNDYYNFPKGPGKEKGPPRLPNGELLIDPDPSNAMPIGFGPGAKRGHGVGGKLGRELAQELGDQIRKKLEKLAKSRKMY